VVVKNGRRMLGGSGGGLQKKTYLLPPRGSCTHLPHTTLGYSEGGGGWIGATVLVRGRTRSSDAAHIHLHQPSRLLSLHSVHTVGASRTLHPTPTPTTSISTPAFTPCNSPLPQEPPRAPTPDASGAAAAAGGGAVGEALRQISTSIPLACESFSCE
jgi:hypothetical protein